MDIKAYIASQFSAKAEFLFQKHPNFCIFRHRNGKWFAVLMKIPANKLSKTLSNADEIEILNLKCDPDFIQLETDFKAIFPAYHMNKKHWISVKLDEISPDLLDYLLNTSYTLCGKARSTK